MNLNEQITYKTASVCLIIIFLLVFFIEKTSFVWIIGVCIILILLITRANLGEVTKKTELFFVTVILIIKITIVILMII